MGQGSEREVVERVEASVERLGRAGPEMPPQPDGLVEVRASDVEPIRDAEVLELALAPADPDAGDHPAAAEAVEGRQLLGEDHGVAVRDDDHARARGGPGVLRADPGEAQDRLVDPPVVVGVLLGDEQVVGRPDRRPAESLGDLGRRLHALARGAIAEVRETESVVHGPDASGRGDQAPRATTLTNAQISSYSATMRRKAGSMVRLERDILEAAMTLRGRGLAEAHGFLLAKTIGDGADAKRLTAYGTLYKALDRLERAGYLESRWEAPDYAAEAARPRRRLYRITGHGRGRPSPTPGPPMPLAARRAGARPESQVT